MCALGGYILLLPLPVFSPLSVCHKRNSFLDMVPLLLSVFPQSYNLWDLICRLKSLYLGALLPYVVSGRHFDHNDEDSH